MKLLKNGSEYGQVDYVEENKRLIDDSRRIQYGRERGVTVIRS